jgi:hypothetical protein
LGVALGAVGFAAWRAGRGRPLPGPRTSEALVTSGALVILADLAADVIPRGPWGFSLGDPSLAGLSAVIAGAGFGYARKARRGERGASVPADDYS